MTSINYTPSKSIQREIEELEDNKKKFKKIEGYIEKVKEEGKTLELNYKEICNIIGEKVEQGNTKYSQIKKWKRFMEFEKIEGSHRYLIKKVYEVPLPKESKQNSLYTKVIELLLMYELSEKEGYTAQYTKTKIYYILGMVNSNFLHRNREMALEMAIERDKEIEDIKSWEMNHFYLMTTSKLNEILMSALKSMRRRCLLDYQEVMMLSYYEGEEGNEKLYTREATNEEWEKVLEVQKEILLKNGWDKVPLIQANRFYEEVNEKIYKKYGWNGAYKEIKLIYTQEYMSKDIPTVLREIRDIIQINQSKLNKQILETLEVQIYKLKDKNEEKIQKEIGGIGKKRIGQREYEKIEEFLYPSTYIEHQKKLIDLFINIGNEVREKDLKEIKKIKLNID